MSDPGSEIAAACRTHGLDLAARARVGDYNRRVDAPHRLDGRGRRDAEILLIGNTRALWPAFVGWLARNPQRLGEPDPLDRYVETTIEGICARFAMPVHIRWAHRAEPAHVSFQTLAEISGLAWRSPASLSVHRVYGPWIALRAAIVLPTVAAAATPARRTCAHCAHGCERRLAALDPVTATWRDWLAVRDACPLGRRFRYPEPQIRYHYTKSKRILRAAIAADSPDRRPDFLL